MKLNRTAAAVLATAVIGGIASAAPASATTTGYEGHTSTNVVVLGMLDGFVGTHHQFRLSTTNGKIDSSYSRIVSWSCPSGASVTPTWASSKCTKRSTFTLKNYTENGKTTLIGRTSSTGASATQSGPILAKSVASTRANLMRPNLSIFSSGSGFRVSGTVNGNSLLTSPRYGSFTH